MIKRIFGDLLLIASLFFGSLASGAEFNAGMGEEQWFGIGKREESSYTIAQKFIIEKAPGFGRFTIDSLGIRLKGCWKGTSPKKNGRYTMRIYSNTPDPQGLFQ